MDVKKYQDYWVVTLNRPEKRNALDVPSLQAFSDILEEAKEIRCLIIQGEGSFFCSGIDLKETAVDTLSELLFKVLQKLNTGPFVTIALVQGGAVAGGVGLLACCDFVISSPDAIFSCPEVHLGLVVALIMPYLAKRVPNQALKRFLLLGEKISSQEAEDRGLVDVISPNLMNEALDLMQKVFLGGPLAIQLTKELLKEPSLEKGLLLHQQIRASSEAKEGIKAHLEKRLPYWVHP